MISKFGILKKEWSGVAGIWTDTREQRGANVERVKSTGSKRDMTIKL